MSVPTTRLREVPLQELHASPDSAPEIENPARLTPDEVSRQPGLVLREVPAVGPEEAQLLRQEVRTPWLHSSKSTRSIRTVPSRW